MASVNIDKLVQEVTEQFLEKQKELVRQLRERAWAEGYYAAVTSPYSPNPYRKANPDAPA